MLHFCKVGLLLALVAANVSSQAQVCSFRIHGTVLDAQLHTIVGAIIRIETDSSKGAVTDTDGAFTITNVCQGRNVLACNAFGYKVATVEIVVSDNSDVRFTLAADDKQLHEIVVNGMRLPDMHTVTQTELKDLELRQSRGQSLGEALKELPGLSSVQTGPTLSKPVIHGLHSNRVLIVNNGVRQEGQQWGAEHSPEIDPFIANNITVVKGAASVRYGSDAIGGVVLVSPDPLPTAKGISGDIYLVGKSNGKMGGASGSLQGAFDKKLKGLSWRVQGTLQKAGNFQTPHYFLANTGFHETDFSAAVGYKWKGFDIAIYYSQYRTYTGIFAGSHADNVTDLFNAFNRAAPLPSADFSYKIDRSYQVVYHDLLKGNINYRFANDGKIELNVARQKDLREEYDVDLPYSNDPNILSKPQVSFQLKTHTLDLAYIEPSNNGFSGSIGITGITQGNVFKGIRYLIPNFRDYGTGAYAIERYRYRKFTFEAGIRYDYRWLRVYQLNANTLQTYYSTFDYSNVSASLGTIYRVNDKLSLSANTGTAWRAPSINELYIHGVHFSDASYQNGDSSLKSERALNTGLSANYQGKKLRATVDVYYNHINKYIYDKPLLQPVTLISGTYPSFLFTQADVNIKGLDASLQYDFVKHFTYQTKVTIVRGYNESEHDYLIYMPADRFENSITLNLQRFRFIDEPYISVENVTTLRQTRLQPNSDFIPAPGGYSLFNANIGFAMQVKKKKLNIDFSVNNLTNVAYRDYLNHFRYYSDDLGINYIIRTKFSF